ncbi:hypothetical protein [Heyndrickxia acidicola]|uniref:Uncharacterized protein n=1 Tax=Heyndrickxia acidicola TaxID=209389 RepID=A0ABU6ML40_9BACI|nr:hypothetical protein [Heyndrickxia acidicola]MED1205399.1 hypothetical protein [Heyndrickxia acidicola]
MNIREYYDEMSAVYLQQLIWICLFLSVFLTVLSAIGRLFYMIWVLLAVFVIVLYFLSRYLYYHYRKNQSSYKMPYKSDYKEPHSFMVMAMPSEEDRIQLFMSNGISEWSIHRVQSKQKNNAVKSDIYTISNQNRPIQAEAAFCSNAASNYAVVQTGQKELARIELQSMEKSKSCFFCGKDEFTVMRSGKSTRIYKNSIELACYEKGWMPFSWQQNFSPNTPILHVNTSQLKDLLVIFTLLIGKLKQEG